MLFGNMIIVLLWIYIWSLFFMYYLIFLIFDSSGGYIYGNYLHKEHKGLQDKLKKFNELFMSFFPYSNLVMMKASLKHVIASGEDVEMHSQFRFFTKSLLMEIFSSKHEVFSDSALWFIGVLYRSAYLTRTMVSHVVFLCSSLFIYFSWFYSNFKKEISFPPVRQSNVKAWSGLHQSLNFTVFPHTFSLRFYVLF